MAFEPRRVRVGDTIALGTKIYWYRGRAGLKLPLRGEVVLIVPTDTFPWEMPEWEALRRDTRDCVGKVGHERRPVESYVILCPARARVWKQRLYWPMVYWLMYE